MISILAYCFSATAQDSGARIENIRTTMTKNALVVTYDLVNTERTHHVAFVVVDDRGNAIHPDSVYGEVGAGISAGKSKSITWEIYKEFDVVHGNFTPRLILDPSEGRKHSGGPAFAGLSLLLPGLGDYFVADPRKMQIKPYYKTAFTAGVLGLSWAAKRKRQEIPPVMAPPGYYLSADAPEGEDYIYIDHEWMKEPGYTDYWLFPYDAEIILGIGVASWLFDVIWVARKGAVNNRVHRQVLDHLSIVPVREGAMLRLSYRF